MIVTHTNPDFDAIAAVWLLKRFGGLENEQVEFVNTGNHLKLTTARAVVDTGKVFDPDHRLFDHHQLEGKAALETCATDQVYRWLIRSAYGVSFQAEDQTPPYEYLEPLVNLILWGDTGDNRADPSRKTGLHALLSGYKAWFFEKNPDTRLSDAAILAYGFGLLDVLEVRLRRQSEARAELSEKTVYKSNDGLVWAIRHGSAGSSFAAFDEGARMVVFEGEPIEVEGGTTYPVGIMRGGEWPAPNVGELAERVAVSKSFTEEIGRWFKHPGGFFAGRGTAKAPVFEPVEIDIAALAEAIDATWVR
jgi:hypothetical protein